MGGRCQVESKHRFPVLYKRLKDPRYFQMMALSGLLLYGIVWLDLGIRLENVLVIVPTALLFQYVLTRVFHLPVFDPKSALISSMSLTLLLRTDLWYLAVLGALITIASKFLIRSRRRHFLNPTNFGLVALMLLSDSVWVSPGQWGNVAFFGFLLLSIGGLVVYRSERSDVTYAFLVFFSALLFGRAIWLGDPLAIPLHQLQNGALLIFTFFMISDPKTTPDSRAGRIVFALLVALGAYFVQFGLFRNNGPLWSLVCFCCLTPLINLLLPGRKYEWNMQKEIIQPKTKGVSHETVDKTRPVGADVGAALPAGAGVLRFLRR